MRFDQSIYTRLYQIAFFMPDIFYKNENDSREIWHPKTNIVDIPIYDLTLKDRIKASCNHVLSHENSSYWCKIFREKMEIDQFEIKLFYVCLKLYNELDSLLGKSFTYDQLKGLIEQLLKDGHFDQWIEEKLKYDESRDQLIRDITVSLNNEDYKIDISIYPLISRIESQINNYQFKKRFLKDVSVFYVYRKIRNVYNFVTDRTEDSPLDAERYFKWMESNNLVSLNEIKRVCKGAFKSIKHASFFYCKFKQSNNLYQTSSVIKEMEKQIPLLACIKKDLYQFFSIYYPVESYAGLNDSLFDLSSSIDLYSKIQDISKEKLIDSFVIERLFDKVVIDCFEVSKQLFAAGAPPKPNVDKNEKIRETKQRNNKEGKEKLQIHFDSISQKISEKPKKKGVIQQVCEKYFDDHKSELEAFNILSAKKLQRKYSQNKTDPNKKRSEYTNGAYIKPGYSPEFQDNIKFLYSEFKDSERST